MTYLLIGGSKSGKSHLAQQLCRSLGGPLVYWATMEPVDGEDRALIARHLDERAGWGFSTVECGWALERAALAACAAPVRVMELCCRSLDAVSVFAEKGSPLAVSDAGCAAVLVEASLRAAALNVFINTRSLRDRAQADALNARCLDMLERYCPLAEGIFGSVLEKTLS